MPKKEKLNQKPVNNEKKEIIREGTFLKNSYSFPNETRIVSPKEAIQIKIKRKEKNDNK